MPTTVGSAVPVPTGSSCNARRSNCIGLQRYGAYYGRQRGPCLLRQTGTSRNARHPVLGRVLRHTWPFPRGTMTTTVGRGLRADTSFRSVEMTQFFDPTLKAHVRNARHSNRIGLQRYGAYYGRQRGPCPLRQTGTSRNGAIL